MSNNDINESIRKQKEINIKNNQKIKDKKSWLKNKVENIFQKTIKKSKLSESVSFVIDNKEKLERNWIDNIWEALSIPERSVEVEGWILKNKGKVLLLRGKNFQETMLHWGVLSTLSLTMALIDCNLSINEKDKDGKTPFDWLMERYNIVFVEKLQKLDENGETRLKAETQSSGVYIWNMGARPSVSFKDLKKGNDMTLLTNIANGELWLIKLLYNTYGKDALTGWLDDRRSMIHIWSLSPDSPVKKQGFEVLMSDLKLRENIIKNAVDEQVLSIDEKDINGRTALWYTVDGLLVPNKGDNYFLRNNAKILLELGADMTEKDLFGVSPYDLVLQQPESNANASYLKKLFEENNEEL